MNKARAPYIRWIFVTQSAQLHRYRERNGVTMTIKSSQSKFRLIKNTFGDSILESGMTEQEFRTSCLNSHISSLLTALQGLHEYTQSAWLFFLIIFTVLRLKGWKMLTWLLVNSEIFLFLAVWSIWTSTIHWLTEQTRCKWFSN